MNDAKVLRFINVDRTLSPNDEMFAGNEQHYFSVGQDALEIIDRTLYSAKINSADVRKILDFPCGHGRVLRYLRAAFPQAEITAADLNSDGVESCAARFGAIPFHSSNDLAQITLPRDHFDLIWVGSLFTHFDAPRWIPFLALFRSLLKPGGLLLFTTQGRRAHELISTKAYRYGLDDRQADELCEKYVSTGFGYVPYSSTQEYGIAFSDPGWVSLLLTSLPEFRLVSVGEKVWDEHHDVYACVRDTLWKPPLTRRK